MKIRHLVILGAFAFASGARADVILDPLHGWCNQVVAGTSCIDLGANTPLGNATKFGFNISPGPNTGDLLLEFLVPNDFSPQPTSISVTGTQGGTANTSAISATATLVSVTAWTSGFLDAYLGLSATPSNGIGAYLPNAQVLDPTATGFFVYQADIGDTRIAANPDTTTGPIFNVTADIAALPLGSYIVGFCSTANSTDTNPCFGNKQNPTIATANSGALLVTDGRVPPEQIPEPGVLALLSLALLGLGITTSRRRV